MEQEAIRLLKAEEIECRVSMVKENGLSLLLYKDARVDQKILDETFGAFGWMRSHQCIEGNLYCTVAIYDEEKKTWVSKQDVGTTSYSEKEKGQASDSFKRACFNWGIGRELYTAPFIWVQGNLANIQKKGDKLYCNDHFKVASIEYNENREITSLVIVNSKGECVYTMQSGKSPEAGSKKQPKRKVQEKALTRDQMTALQVELDRTGVTVAAVQERYQIKQMETMGETMYKRVMEALAKTKDVAA
ncbi:MAG: hypothetical protein K2O59_00795 [Lachnospiraceae bacterium]|nr:hypothetical protein [Lachnospiraceae bacterium]